SLNSAGRADVGPILRAAPMTARNHKPVSSLMLSDDGFEPEADVLALCLSHLKYENFRSKFWLRQKE
ncbi:hypothetical protein, partial [Ruegeria sp. AU67]|uniref:hypothetical protein n=1 Tax=Ruegeria sp. AU67 TaxID=2108530 RepID=UPI001F2BD262